MTKQELQRVGKQTYYISKAACDKCGTVDSETFMGQVTAPLPNGWKATLVPCGKFSKLGYACTTCAA